MQRQKIQSDYNEQPDRIKDILRSIIVLDDPASANAVFGEVGKRFHMVGNTRNLLDPSANPVDGYRDAKINIQVPQNHIAEGQVNVQEMLDAKLLAHKLYKERSDIEPIPGDKSPEQLTRINELNHEMKTKYYDPAWKLFLSKSKAAKSIAVPLRDTESSGNTLGGDVSYASVRNPPDGVFNVDTGVPSTSQYMKPSSPSRFIKTSDDM